MKPFVVDPSDFGMTGAYYPTGRVFAMFPDEGAARAAVDAAQAVPGVASVALATPASIQQAFAKRAAEVGGMPSVGREDQFMLRFVELAGLGKAGALIEVDKADTGQLSEALYGAGAVLAYYYRTLVIEELVDPTPRAEAAAAGKL